MQLTVSSGILRTHPDITLTCTECSRPLFARPMFNLGRVEYRCVTRGCGQQISKGVEGDGVSGAHSAKSLFICPNRVLNPVQKR